MMCPGDNIDCDNPGCRHGGCQGRPPLRQLTLPGVVSVLPVLPALPLRQPQTAAPAAALRQYDAAALAAG
jgi:hypothetical protein